METMSHCNALLICLLFCPCPYNVFCTIHSPQSKGCMPLVVALYTLATCQMTLIIKVLDARPSVVSRWNLRTLRSHRDNIRTICFLKATHMAGWAFKLFGYLFVTCVSKLICRDHFTVCASASLPITFYITCLGRFKSVSC